MFDTPRSPAALDEAISDPPDSAVAAIAESAGDFAVLGAGGKMGFHVARMIQRCLELAGRRDPIRVVSRFSSPAARQLFAQHHFDVVAADLSDPDQVAGLPLAANVIYLAGVKFGTSSSPDLLHRMNVVMPRLVAEHYRDSRIVALSTGCVYSFTTATSGGSTETDPTDPPGEYARSCLGREQAFIDSSIAHGTAVALVRLNYSIDLRYGVLVDIAKNVFAGNPVNVDTGHVNVIWQGDAVAHILCCLPHTQSPPWIVNVTGAETLAVRDLANRFGRLLDREVTFTGQEQPTAWLSNAARSHRLFGPPRVSAGEMTEWIAGWLKRGGETLDKPTQFQNRDGQY